MKTRTRLVMAVLGSSIVTAALLITGAGLWLSRFWTEYTDVVRRSPYRVVVQGEPTISGTLYRLDRRAAYLLVLTSKSAQGPEAYYIDFVAERMGLANFPQYVPLGRCALVDRETLDGIYSEAEIEADWDLQEKWREMRIRIKDFIADVYAGHDAAQRAEEGRALIPLGYQREIILTEDCAVESRSVVRVSRTLMPPEWFRPGEWDRPKVYRFGEKWGKASRSHVQVLTHSEQAGEAHFVDYVEGR